VSKNSVICGSFALVMMLGVDTWLKTADGKWQCIATQDSPIK